MTRSWSILLCILMSSVVAADVVIVNTTNDITGYVAPGGSFGLPAGDSLRLNIKAVAGSSNVNFQTGGGHTFTWQLFNLADATKYEVQSGANTDAPVIDPTLGQVRIVTDVIPDPGEYEIYVQAVPISAPSAAYPIAWHYLSVTSAPAATSATISGGVTIQQITGGIVSNVYASTTNHWNPTTGELWINVSNCQSIAFTNIGAPAGTVYVTNCFVSIGTNAAAGGGGSGGDVYLASNNVLTAQNEINLADQASVVEPALKIRSGMSTGGNTNSLYIMFMTDADTPLGAISGLGDRNAAGGQETLAIGTHIPTTKDGAGVLTSFFELPNRNAEGAVMLFGSYNGQSFISQHILDNTGTTNSVAGQTRVYYVWDNANPRYRGNVDKSDFDFAWYGDVNATPVLYMDAGNHRVGVNYDTPSYDLDVGGNTQVQSNFYLGNIMYMGSVTGHPAPSATHVLNYNLTGTAYTMNVVGDITPYSPHRAGRKMTASENVYTGERWEADELSVLELLTNIAYQIGLPAETYTGVIHRAELPEDRVRSWRQDQLRYRAIREAERASWDARQVEIVEARLAMLGAGETNNLPMLDDPDTRPPEYTIRPEPDFISRATNRTGRVESR